MRGFELFTPAERRLSVLLFVLALVGETAHVGRRVSPDVARWLDAEPKSPVPAETTRAPLVSRLEDTLRVPANALLPDTAEGIDPNTADLTTLQQLPGVGPILAQRILEDRATQGPYRRPEDLLRIPGIGPAKLAKMRSHLRLK